MELQTRNIAKYTVVNARGRLDAAWAEYFTDTFLNYVRNGNHHIVIEASEMEFLSSAGIRSLVRINKEIFLVKGSFSMVNSTEFVSKTLETTGFGDWLSTSFPDDMVADPEPEKPSKPGMNERYLPQQEQFSEISVVDAWTGWNPVDLQNLQVVLFPEAVFALGVGSSSLQKENAINESGEFMAIDGNLVYQAPGEKGRPDYQLSVSQFVPEMLVMRALVVKGALSHLFRFAPTDEKTSQTLSELAAEVLSVTSSQVAAFVIAGEIDGLVGASLIQSPGQITETTPAGLTDMRDWLSFSGDRVFTGEQAVIFGIVSSDPDFGYNHLLRQHTANKLLYTHMHATIFPYQPLPNGNIELKQQIGKFFGGPPPIALMHLIDDNRPTQQLGESSLIRGACWCAPVKEKEGVL